MNYLKTFEELWPFKKESEAEKNKKSLITICKWLIDSLYDKKLIGHKIKKVEVGYSQVKDNVFIIQFIGEDSTVVRFSWLIDKDFRVVDLDKYYVIESGKITLHFLKHKADKVNKDKYQELDLMVDKMNKFFTANKLI